MKAISNSNLLLSLLILLLSACAQATPANVTEPAAATPTMGVTATVAPIPTKLPEETATAQLSFTPSTYTDETAGFQFDYPADWTLEPNQVIGTRGSAAQLFSPGTTSETLATGGSRMAVTTYLWDPQNDLTAYVEHRKSAWEGSGSTIKSQESWKLSDERQVMSFILEGPDQAQAVILITTIGANYLELSGEGDLTLIAEITHTLRPLPTQ